tara:strand:+ start:1705 stop:2478 length:774 start_codon:yes stop_codon:yes gene_type:complete
MLLVISPAKSLNFDSKSNANSFSEPHFLSDAERINSVLKKKSVNKLMKIQEISKNLAELNHNRNQNWISNNTDLNSKQAVSAFQGDVYLGLSEADFTKEDYSFAQNHLRILSGLYGILKPLDRIQPYRLEMGTALKTTRGKNLYEFWKLRITNFLNEEFEQEEKPVLINLASDEYFKSIKPTKLNATIIQAVFMDKKNGKYKVISFFAKKARGMMARFIIKNRITTPEGLKAFDSEGYLYNESMSTDTKWVFARDTE